MMPFGQKLATGGAESSLAVRLFIVPMFVKLTRSVAGASMQALLVWARAQDWERELENGSLRLTREGDRPDVSESDTSG